MLYTPVCSMNVFIVNRISGLFVETIYTKYETVNVRALYDTLADVHVFVKCNKMAHLLRDAPCCKLITVSA